MALFSIIWSGMIAFFSLFWFWLSIFAAPFQQFQMLWLIIPIYFAWIFTDFFQERRGTSIGNAITNGVVLLWASIDWTRTLVNIGGSFSWSLVTKYLVIATALGYGLAIIIEGLRGEDVVTRIGRIREVTYVLLMFTPIIYGEIELGGKYLLAVVLFFPLFYYFFEFIDTIILPKSKIIQNVEESEKKMEEEKKLFVGNKGL